MKKMEYSILKFAGYLVGDFVITTVLHEILLSILGVFIIAVIMLETPVEIIRLRLFQRKNNGKLSILY